MDWFEQCRIKLAQIIWTKSLYLGFNRKKIAPKTGKIKPQAAIGKGFEPLATAPEQLDRAGVIAV